MPDDNSGAKKYRARVLDWSDERRSGNPIMVTLAYGWAFWASENANSAEHVRGFDTAAEAYARIKNAQRCKCSRCISKQGG